MLHLATVLLLFTSNTLSADTDPVYRVGNGVIPPKVLHKVDPAYSREAERERIQGTALYSLVVDKSGRARDIDLLSPIGYGLDEKGLDAIRQWLFKPAEKDGMPVSVYAVIEVHFRFAGLPFDSKAEEHRTSYNAAIHNLAIPDRKTGAIESIQKLATQNYPPAMSVLGQWMIEGTEVPQDVGHGIELVTKASGKYERHGLYVLGMLYITGQHVPADSEKGLKLVRDASMYGSIAAQFYLGNKYEKGEGLNAPDPERARYYFRLCAARGDARCQFEMGRLLTPVPGTTRGDPVQAIAWLELAHDASIQQAEPLLASLRQSLSAEDIERARKLKTQLVRR